MADACPTCGADHTNEPDCPVTLGASMRPAAKPGTIGGWLAGILDEAHRRNQARRERVLRYDDLREALTQRPLRYSKPENWNGDVGPRYLADDPGEYVHSDRVNAGHRRTVGQRENDSPERAVLVAICALAYQREVEAGRPPADEPDLIELFAFPFAGLQRGDRYDWPKQPALDFGQAAETADTGQRADYQHEPARGRADE